MLDEVEDKRVVTSQRTWTAAARQTPLRCIDLHLKK